MHCQPLYAVVSCRFYATQAAILAGLTLGAPDQVLAGCRQLGTSLTDLKFVFTDASSQGLDDVTGLMNNMQVHSSALALPPLILLCASHVSGQVCKCL